MAFEHVIKDATTGEVTIIPFTQDEIDQYILRANAAQIDALRAKAKEALSETDWVDNASVRNETFNPHLVNGDEFDKYRLALRKIAISPPMGEVKFPEKPDAIWS